MDFAGIARIVADTVTSAALFGRPMTYVVMGSGAGVPIMGILDLQELAQPQSGQAQVYVREAILRVRKEDVPVVTTGRDTVRMRWDGQQVTARVQRVVDGNGAMWVLEVRR